MRSDCKRAKLSYLSNRFNFLEFLHEIYTLYIHIYGTAIHSSHISDEFF